MSAGSSMKRNHFSWGRGKGRRVGDPLVAATPAAWVPFAQRNAELAAQLDRARSRSAK